MKKISIIALLALAFAAPVLAVQNYSCNFENAADRARWKLNPTANQGIFDKLTNRWYIGAPGNNEKDGAYGLYISDNGGNSAHYTNNACWVFAYDTLSLDKLTSGDYTLTFDYSGMGNVASNFDGIYFLWIPMVDPETGDSIKIGSISTSSGIPSTYENYVISLQPKAMIDFVGGTQTWRQCEATIPNKKCDGKPHYLAFVWANASALAQQPAAKIDNISVMDTRPCDAPTNLQLAIQGTTSTVSWSGTATEYEVTAYSYEEDTWYGPKMVTGNSTTFSNLPIGQTDFIVRAKCQEDLFSLKTSISKLVYYPDQMCVDYLNLDNAKCYTGTGFKNTTTFSNYVIGPAVDNGPGNAESRHTIHFDKNERDPRSNGQLPTIPEGELASVRLGNVLGGNQTERIEYSFNVDTINYPVLLLKYAPILEAPTHQDYENPRFMLDIRIGNSSIGQCGRADFNANTVRAGKDEQGTTTLTPEAIAQGWHVTPKAYAQANGDDVIWKEWTTVGVNLKKQDYQGKKLTVRLSTFDCAMTQHGGYAYFTLSCSDGKLKGMKCGEINPVFEAPDGFVYSWAYKSSEKYRDSLTGIMPEQYILGHEQLFEAGMQDDSVYVVDCMFVQDSTCFFSLYASTLATNPIAVMNEPKIIKNCRDGIYQVKFDATPSWVQEIDHVKDDTLVSRIYHIDRYEWNVEGLPGGWSDEVSPTFNFPTSGGDYTVRLTTSCGTCDSTIYYQLHLDSLGSTHETREVYLCDDVRKAGYVWNEKPDTLYKDYGLDSVILYSETTSCDSVIYLNLLEPERVYVDTMVLPESLPFIYRGREYTQTMIDTIPNDMCDTTWVLNFEVYESVQVDMPTEYVLCEHDPVLTLVYDVTRGRSLRYSYKFDDPAIPSISPVSEVQKKGYYELPIALDPNLTPNIYKGSILFEDSLPKFNVTIPFTVSMRYSKDVIAQRWNDVLAIRNAMYNGGYDFDSVQWYVSGMPIEGATDFNYYAGEGQQLRMGEEYQALLTRKGENVKVFTCPFIPVPVAADVTDMPSLVPMSAPLPVKGKGTAYWYDMLGRQYSSETYDDSSIRTPGAEGLYLLVLQNETARSIHQVMVR